VMPASFVCPPAVVLRGTPPSEQAELWIPHAMNLEAGQRGAHYLAVIGRLASGSTFESADREMNVIQEQIEREVPNYKTWRARVVPLALGLLAAVALHAFWNGVVSDRITTVLCNPPIPGGACGPAPDTTDLLIRVPLLEAAFLLPIAAALVRVVRRAEASR